MSELGKSANIKSGSSKPRTAKPLKKSGKSISCKFLLATNLHNLKREDIYKYIVSLHKRIRKLVKKCKKYKEKVSKLRECTAKRNISQKTVVPKTIVKHTEEKKNETIKHQSKECNKDELTAENFIADIKDAAQAAQNDTGFVYEPTSGLYYDRRTGYYYNAEHGLYYDGNNGCYYSYNQDDNKFEFHSQVYSDESTSIQAEQIDRIADDNQNLKRKRKLSPGLDNISQRPAHKSKKPEVVCIQRRKVGSEKSSEVLKRPKSSNKIESGDIDENKEDGEISDDEDENDDDNDDEVYSDRNKQIFTLRGSPGEIDDTSNSSSVGSDQTYDSDKFQDIAKKYPPSLRIVVQETNITKLKIGELFLLTYKGGSLGREGNHDVIIPDINCSKYHLRFTYDENSLGYTCTDLGSRNGTIMNGKRMSNAKQESDPLALLHGTTLQIGQTKLLCHIHDGHSTCGQCEPGLLQARNDAGEAIASDSKVTNIYQKSLNTTEQHKRQLKNLKKRYGLEDEKYRELKTGSTNDRAAQRRQKVGSSCDSEKTKTASLDASISSENKGFKMLSKLGWSEGQTLGKNQDGLLEPIPLQSNQGQKGLGCNDGIVAPSFNCPRQVQKATIWKKTQERYSASESAVNIFEENSNDSN